MAVECDHGSYFSIVSCRIDGQDASYEVHPTIASVKAANTKLARLGDGEKAMAEDELHDQTLSHDDLDEGDGRASSMSASASIAFGAIGGTRCANESVDTRKAAFSGLRRWSDVGRWSVPGREAVDLDLRACPSIFGKQRSWSVRRSVRPCSGPSPATASLARQRRFDSQDVWCQLG